MSDLRAIVDRVGIEALRGELTDAAMMRDYDRAASLFTRGGAVRMPHLNVELAGQEEIRDGGEQVPALVDYFVQTAHLGTIRLDGDTASGRAYICELIRLRDGRSELNELGPDLRLVPAGDLLAAPLAVGPGLEADHTSPSPRAVPVVVRVAAPPSDRSRWSPRPSRACPPGREPDRNRHRLGYRNGSHRDLYEDRHSSDLVGDSGIEPLTSSV
jgi:hypothetical protein